MKNTMSLFSIRHMLAIALIVGLCCFFTTKSQAEVTTDSSKIGVVNMDIIMRKSVAAQNIRSQVDKKRKQYQAKIQKQEKDVLAFQQGVLKEQDELKKEELIAKKKLFKQKVITVQKNAQNEMRQIDVAVEKSLQELRQKSATIVRGIAKKRGFDIVLSHQQVVLAIGSLDITNEVLARLDKEVKTIPIKWK